LEQLLSFVIFGDGCAATLVSAEATGLRLLDFYGDIAPGAADLITWRIGDQGFHMHLSGGVPKAIETGLPLMRRRLLPDDRPITHWAIHPGGKAVLDAVQTALNIPKGGLRQARDVLRQYGNMSSASVLFVLQKMLGPEAPAGFGLAMAFGPGLTVESMRFAKGDVI
jgi:predicted naringenin-chalcone synthase